MTPQTQAEQKAREFIKIHFCDPRSLIDKTSIQELTLLTQKAEQYSELETLIKCDSHSKGLDTPIDVLNQLALTLKELKEKDDALDWLRESTLTIQRFNDDKGFNHEAGNDLLAEINQARKEQG